MRELEELAPDAVASTLTEGLEGAIVLSPERNASPGRYAVYGSAPADRLSRRT